MRTIGAYEAKTHLPKLLEDVKKGERIIITKHGLPVALLGPADLSKTIPTDQIINEIKNLRKKNKLHGLSIREMINDGRR